MELILLVIAILLFASAFKGNKYPKWMPAKLKNSIKKMEKEIQRAKKLEKEAIKKGRPDLAAKARENYKAMERIIYNVKNPSVSAESIQQQKLRDLERQVEEAERRARDAEWAAWHR